MNKVIMIGNVTKEVELRFAPSGTAVAKFTVALNDGWGEKKTVSYINCVAFGKTAEATANFTHKGSKVAVDGRLQTGSYDSKEGHKVYTTDVIVNQIKFLDSKGQAKQDEDVFTPTDDNPFDDSDSNSDIPF